MTRILLAVSNALGHPVTVVLFCALALSSLPDTIREHSSAALVQWTAQTFIQLVALAIIQFQQNRGNREAARGTEETGRLIRETHDDTKAILADAVALLDEVKTLATSTHAKVSDQ